MEVTNDDHTHTLQVRLRRAVRVRESPRRRTVVRKVMTSIFEDAWSLVDADEWNGEYRR